MPCERSVSISEFCSVSLPFGGAKYVHFEPDSPRSEQPFWKPTWPAFQ